MQTLIKDIEVLNVAAGDSNLDTSALSPYIVPAEEQYLVANMGVKLYDLMIADIQAEFYTDIEGAKQFVFNKSYTTGTVVEYKEKYYKALQATDGTQLPTTHGTHWERIIKFSNEHYDTFWFDWGLRRLLSFAVFAAGSIGWAIRVTDVGVGSSQSEQFKPSSGKDLALLNRTFGIQIDSIWARIDRLLRSDANKDNFKEYLGNEGVDTDDELAGKYNGKRTNAGFALLADNEDY